MSPASAVGLWDTYREIVIEEGQYNIGHKRFPWGVNDEHLTELTKQVLDIFADIESVVNNQVSELKSTKNPDFKQAVRLDKDYCQARLRELAARGLEVYRDFFNKKEARDLLNSRLAFDSDASMRPAPTFVSTLTPFPWEVLYQGDDEERPEAEMFWGCRYAVGRILNERDVAQYVMEQGGHSNTLMCLHHKLIGAYTTEWEAIQRAIKSTDQASVRLLGPTDLIRRDGKGLLDHLDRAGYNILHFACHGRQCDAVHDELEISLLLQSDLEHIGDPDFEPPTITLQTRTFTMQEGAFSPPPLVFLNACQSAGGADRLRNRYNLPLKFLGRGAAAIVATACAVPDVFAAEFARVFYGYFLHGIESQVQSGAVEGVAVEKPKRRVTVLGEALRLSRCYFLEKYNNPLGLAYGLYTPAYYHVPELLLGRGMPPWS